MKSKESKIKSENFLHQTFVEELTLHWVKLANNERREPGWSEDDLVLEVRLPTHEVVEVPIRVLVYLDDPQILVTRVEAAASLVSPTLVPQGKGVALCEIPEPQVLGLGKIVKV